MSANQQTAVMQAATLRCPPNVFRERYSLADFEVNFLYGEGPNWSICAARCKWSNAPVVIQTYTEVGNLSGCMALALAAAHGLTHHPSLLPLYAVFRDVPSPAGGHADNGAGHGDRVVMVYPGGPAQHPLDVGSSSGSLSSSPPRGSLGSSGPPVSERGVVRGLLQPLADLVAVLGPMGLRPPYVCGLDVWMDSPEAPGPGQALFMVPLMCHRRSQNTPAEILPAAFPYASPYLREHPSAAGDQREKKEELVKRWLSWSAAALVYTLLIGSPPPDKAPSRKPPRSKQTSDVSSICAPGVPLLPPLTNNSNGNTPRGPVMMMVPQRQSGSGAPPGLNRMSGSGNIVNGGGSNDTNLETTSSGNHRAGCVSIKSPRRNTRAVDPMPLWLSDEAGDWFRRGLSVDCSTRETFDEQIKHAWVFRHAMLRNITYNYNVTKRESLNHVPRELHPLMLDVLPMGVTRPAREEVDNLMAEIAMTEAPSIAKPAMPWQVVEGPQAPGPEFVLVDEFTQETSGDADLDTSVVERYEVAEEQKDDGTRVTEELRVVSGKHDGALSRAAKALQAAMARRAETGQWVMVNPRGTTFDDIARQKELNQLRTQVSPPSATKHRESSDSPLPVPQAAQKRSPEPQAQATTSSTATAPNVTAFSRSGPVPTAGGRNKSPGPKGAKGGVPKNGKMGK